MVVPKIPRDKVIGSWKVGRLLGEGGQGPVYEVRPTRSKHSPPRALKVCFAEDAAARARFTREIELLEACRSVHVLALIEASPTWEVRLASHPPFAYFVAEICEGSLEALAERHHLGGPVQRLRWFLQACEAVASIHDGPRRVVHRDIKAANFLLAEEPRRLVLADFGIARPEEDDQKITTVHEVVGTQRWRAPESVKDLRSDIYSLGRLLEWLLTEKVAPDLVPPPLPRGGELSDSACVALDAIIAKAANPMPAQRFASVREMIEALPQLWVDVKPTAGAVAASPGNSVMATARALVREGDPVRWRDLKLEVRRAFPAAMDTWRVRVEREPANTKEQRAQFVDGLVAAAQERISLALFGLTSPVPAIADESRTLDELIAPPSWPQSGPSRIVEAPRCLGYVYQHLRGALCCELGRVEAVLDLADKEIVGPARYGSRQAPLWRQHDLTSFPPIFEKSNEAWEYLCGIGKGTPLVDSFYALPLDFEFALATYSALMTLWDFAHDAPRLQQGTVEDLVRDTRCDVQPMFMTMDEEIVQAAAARVFGTKSVVDLVVARGPSTREQLEKAWPVWKSLLRRLRSSLGRGFLLPNEVPLVDLA